MSTKNPKDQITILDQAYNRLIDRLDDIDSRRQSLLNTTTAKIQKRRINDTRQIINNL